MYFLLKYTGLSRMLKVKPEEKETILQTFKEISLLALLCNMYVLHVFCIAGVLSKENQPCYVCIIPGVLL